MVVLRQLTTPDRPALSHPSCLPEVHSTLPWNLALQTAHSSQWSCLPSSGQPFSSPSPGCPLPSLSVALPGCTVHWGINHRPPCVVILVSFLCISPLQGWGLVLLPCPHKAWDSHVATGHLFPRGAEAQIMDSLSCIFSGSSNSARYLSMHQVEVVRNVRGQTHARCLSLSLKKKNQNILHRAHILPSRLVSRGFLRVPQKS